METEFQNAIGKSVGEVVRDISEFLSASCVICKKQQQIDLAALLPELNMAEQYTFALFSEASAQGWELDVTESFYRRAAGMVISEEVINSIAAAFRAPDSEEFAAYQKKYGNCFSLLDGSYWSTVLAIAIDAGAIAEVMQYLRLFTVSLMEFAYMDGKNPEKTYTWVYYESFRSMLDSLTAPPEPDPLPLKVRALGGTAGKREGDSYALSLGVDIENPNPGHMARGITLDITLKDREGNVITVIKDRIQNIDPATVYHYGVTKQIKGAAASGISAVAKTTDYLKLKTPIMKHIKLTSFKLSKQETGITVSGKLTSEYDRSLRAVTLHYQLLSEDNKILGGSTEWLFDRIEPNQSTTFQASLPVHVKGTAKAVYSIDFDALELVK